MLSKEQYDSLKPYIPTLSLFKTTGQWVGGDAVFNIHRAITGEIPNMSCNSCRAKVLVELNIMIELYEKGNM